MNEGQGGNVLGGINSSDFVFSAPSNNVMVDNSGRKGWKKWVIRGVIGLAVVGAILLAVFLIRALLSKSPEDVERAYWSYMNYLVRGEDSTEALSKDDYRGVETAVKKAFLSGGSGYFDGLEKEFNSFRKVFRRSSMSSEEALSEEMKELGGLVEFVIDLNKIGVLGDEEDLIAEFVSGQDLVANEKRKVSSINGDSSVWAEQYIEERLGFVELFEKYLRRVEDAGCLKNSNIDMMCVLSNDSINDDSSSDNDYLYQLRRTEKIITDLLVSNSWDMQNLLLGDVNV